MRSLTLAVCSFLLGPGIASAESLFGRPLFQAPAALVDTDPYATSADHAVVDVAFGDLDGDGFGELVTRNRSQTAPDRYHLAFLHFERALWDPILFEWPVTPPGYAAPPNPGPAGIALGDLTGDGRADLVSILPDGVGIAVQHSAGSGFAPPVNHGSPSATDAYSRVALADLDQDGKLDVVALGYEPATSHYFVDVYRNTGGGALNRLDPSPVALPGSAAADLFVRDLTMDGLPDLILNRSTEVQVHRNTGSNTFAAPVALAAPTASILDLAVARLTVDLIPDLAIVTSDRTLVYYTGLGTGAFSGPPAPIPLQSNRARWVAAGDLDKNGWSELYVSHEPDPFLDTPDGMIEVALAYPSPDRLSPGPAPGRCLIGDVDRDGTDDVIVPRLHATDDQVAVIHGPLEAGRGIELPAASYSQFNNTLSTPGVADFNRDGKPDLVIGIGSGLGIIWLGTGAGTFTPPSAFPFGEGSLAVGADMDLDGKPDLLFAAGSSGYYYAPGNGDGTFGAATVNNLGGFGRRLPRRPVADMNRDGQPDLLWMQYASGHYCGYGPNGFGETGPLSDYPTDCAAVDLDRDGDLDLAVATLSGLELHRSDGVNLPDAMGILEPGRMYVAVASADLDRDGKPDLVASRGITSPYDHARSGIDVYYTDGAFGVVRRDSLGAAEGWSGLLEIWDVNRDGRPDIVTSSYDPAVNTRPAPATTSVHLQRADGTFSQRLDYAQGFIEPARFAHAADVDGDRQLDVIAGGVSLSTGSGPTMSARILRGNSPDGAWGVSGQIECYAPIAPVNVVTGDVNRDGSPDLVSGDAFGGITVHLGLGNGTFAPRIYTSTPSHSIQQIALADMNRDGKLDVVATTQQAALLILAGAGDGTFGAPAIMAVPNEVLRRLAVADFDRDGKADVIATGIQPKAYVFLGDGAGGLIPYQTIAPSVPADMTAANVAVADLNRDGSPDLILTTNGGTTTPRVYVAAGVGFQGFGAPVLAYGDQLTGELHGLAVGDVDKNGKPDVVVTLNDGGSNPLVVIHGDGAGGFLSDTEYPNHANSDWIVLDYLDGDSWLDVVSSSQWDTQLSVRRGNGAGGFGARTDFGTAFGPQGIAVADLDRDGMNDLAFCDTDDSIVWVMLNTGVNVTGVTEENAPRAPRIALAQNAPNPFNPRTTIRFSLPVGGPARLTVYDVRGRRVATLVDRPLPAGGHEVGWAGKDDAGRGVASGVYFYRLEAEGRVASRRMILMK